MTGIGVMQSHEKREIAGFSSRSILNNSMIQKLMFPAVRDQLENPTYMTFINAPTTTRSSALRIFTLLGSETTR
jgi:hypothetical protein